MAGPEAKVGRNVSFGGDDGLAVSWSSELLEPAGVLKYRLMLQG